jgi:hypothetical protein
MEEKVRKEKQKKQLQSYLDKAITENNYFKVVILSKYSGRKERNSWIRRCSGTSCRKRTWNSRK